MYEGVDAITNIQYFGSRRLQPSSQKPEAKIILTVRESEEEWLDSWKRQCRFIKDFPFYVKISNKHFLHNSRIAIFGSSNPEATALFRKKYRQHNERVQAVIPAERLLVFNVNKDGNHCVNFLDAIFRQLSLLEQMWLKLIRKRSLQSMLPKPNPQYYIFLAVAIIVTLTVEMAMMQK